MNVANELVNQWFGDFYHPKDEQFRREFSRQELVSLDEFHARYETRLSMLPNSLDQMLQNRAWQEIMDSASEVLAEHSWLGIEACYDDWTA